MSKTFSQQLEQLIESFPTIPFLFIGSGISRRYYNLPNWETLLKHFTSIISDDNLKFPYYKNKTNNNLPQIGTLLENDFNEWWFKNHSNFKLSEESINYINDGISPFKCAVAEYLKKHSIISEEYKEEIQKFTEISSNHIAGFITTNYDDFIETHSDNYAVFSSQDELLFSPLQNIGEVYKIHGTVSNPTSIVITQNDYDLFSKKSKYLASKLLTIFVEYPIIFLGYSINDPNMQQIITDICDCLPKNKLDALKNRFFIIERAKNSLPNGISTVNIVIGDNSLPFTKITLSDFGQLYTALKRKKSSLPVRLLRFFKNEFYTYVLTNTPSASLKVTHIDDKNVHNNDLVMAIAAPSNFGKFGLTGVDGPQWYSNYLLENLNFSADDLLEFSYPSVIKSNQKLPIYKYLKEAKGQHPQVSRNITTLNDLFNKTIEKRRLKITNKSVVFNSLLNQDLLHDLNYIIDNIDDNINLDELYNFLRKIIQENPNVLSRPNISTEFKRLIRIYDWIKYR